MSTDTGRFWLCPECHKHVAMRLDACKCGFDRTTVPVKMREVSARPHPSPSEEEPRRISWAPWALVVLLVGWIAYTQLSKPTGNVRTAATGGRAAPPGSVGSEGSPEPPIARVEIIPLPGAPASTLALAPDEAQGSQGDGQGSQNPQARPPAGYEVLRIEVPAVASPPPPEESDTERMRREGAAEFAREMARLEVKADQADIAWHRYVEGCHLEVTSAFAGAGAGGRNWFAFAFAGTTTTRQTDACAEAGTFYSLVDQVRAGMCVAEDRARMAYVYPGTRRDLRRNRRLDWDGWDRICPQR